MAGDPYKYFRIEAAELLGQLAQGLLDLEKRGADRELVAKLLRAAHTLKGAARIVKQRVIADGAHALEDALAPWRDGATGPALDGALALLDTMTAALATLPEAPAALESRDPKTESRGDVKSEPRGDPAAIESASLAGARSDAQRRGESIDDVLGGLAELHALVGRLRATSDPRLLAQRLDQLERELASVRQDAERLRLSPITTLFTPLERTARDAAAAAHKSVSFTATGGEVRVDAQVLGALHGSAVQLVRNAVAHGIESPAIRAAAGKPAEGRVAIEVQLQGSRVVVTCRDDGAGIDLEAIRRAALRRGQAAAELDADQLIALVLRGGLSTSAQVTELAGRGIGLDVVRETARQLGGEVTAQTHAGRGTTFVIAVPISVASIAALAVEAGGRRAVIPLVAVRRIVRLGTLVRTGDRLALPVDDATIPYAQLGHLLGAGASDAKSAVIIEGGGQFAALGVTRTLGVETVVVRALPEGASIEAIVSGIALDAEGQPRPVLEPAAIALAVRDSVATPVVAPARPRPILIVDDSLTTRMLERGILESAGYEVELAASAEEGLAKAAETAYALFLVDVEMPGMDGFAFISEIRARRELADIPAILVTSRTGADDRRRGIAVGAQGYVVKGELDQVQLLAMIRKLVRA